MSFKCLSFILLGIVFSACASEKQRVESPVESKQKEPSALVIDSKLPAWLIEKIKVLAKDESIVASSSVLQFSYKNKTYYTLPVGCCDQFVPLFDAEGKLLCHPEGGISGSGDGKCKGLQNQLKNSKVVWSK